MKKVGGSNHGNMIIYDKNKFSVQEVISKPYKNNTNPEKENYTQNFVYIRFQDKTYGNEFSVLCTHVKSKVMFVLYNLRKG